MTKRAINYLDGEFIQDYKDIRKFDKDVNLEADHLTPIQIQYLYMRSFYPEIEKSSELRSVIDFYHNQIKKYWTTKNLYSTAFRFFGTFSVQDTVVLPSASTEKSLASNLSVIILFTVLPDMASLKNN